MASYPLVDPMAQYTLRGNVRVQLNLNNALDEEYRFTSYWWSSPYTYGEPRNITVSLSYDW